MSESSAARSVLMKHPVGLHARPSVKLTRLAKSFRCRIEVSQHASGPWIDAKSIVKVMALKAPRDSTLHFRAEGEGAAEAVNALSALVARDFDEDHADAATS
jgi:phosphocarrier protein HPr